MSIDPSFPKTNPDCARRSAGAVYLTELQMSRTIAPLRYPSSCKVKDREYWGTYSIVGKTVTVYGTRGKQENVCDWRPAAIPAKQLFQELALEGRA